MPYINKVQRESFDKSIEELIKTIQDFPQREGILNYIITNICIGGMEKLSYAEINKIIGVLECVKLEFYRRLASPYEDKKTKDNGDIPGYEI